MRKKTFINIICLLVILLWFILFFDTNMTEIYVVVSAFVISLISIALLPNKKNYLFTFLPLVLPMALLFYSKFGFARIMPVIMLLCDFKYLKRICILQKDKRIEKKRKNVKKSDAEFLRSNTERYILILANTVVSVILINIYISYIISQNNFFTSFQKQFKLRYFIFISFVLLMLVILSSKRYVEKNTQELKIRLNLKHSSDYHIMYIAALIFFAMSIAAFTSSTTDILKTVYPWLMYIFILIFYKDPFIDFAIEKSIQKLHTALESL